MVTLHEVITFLVSMQISISSLQTHNVNRCGRSRHLARKLSLRRKRSSPNVFEMAATETITSIILIKLIRVSLGTVRHPRRFKIVIFLMSRKIILIKQELLLLVYELNRSGLLAENEKIRPILAQLEKLLLCDLSPSTNDSVKN